MKRLSVLVSLFVVSVSNQPACADTEFVDSVPLEVARQFVGNPLTGAGTLYADILDAFPPFIVPVGFKVLASADQGYVQRVILSTALDEEAASAALTAAFVAEGWVQVPLYNMAGQQTGFVSADQPAVGPQQLCHNDHGTLTFTVSASAGKRYINISRNAGAPGMTIMRPGCAEMIAKATQNLSPMGLGRGNTLAAYVPKLIMPKSNVMPAPVSRAFMGGGGAGSMYDWESSGSLTIDWGIDEIYTHFAMQIAEQGWALDSEATGEMVATGNWTKNIDAMNLVGALSILKLAESTFDLRFRVIRQAGTQPAAAGGPVVESMRIVRDPAL